MSRPAGIEPRLRNLLDTELDPSLLSVVVASDGSTDGSDDVARAFPDPRVRVVRHEPRGGKSLAQNRALFPGAVIEMISVAEALMPAGSRRSRSRTPVHSAWPIAPAPHCTPSAFSFRKERPLPAHSTVRTATFSPRPGQSGAAAPMVAASGA